MEESKNQSKKEEGLQGRELYEFRKHQKDRERQKEQKKESLKQAPKKVAKYFPYALGLIAIAGGIGWLVWNIANTPNLPPTTPEGHTEESPAAHIMSIPIPDTIQRHMLEHADGKGKPGIIIQYNCTKYSCASDLIAKLTELVKQYPDNVYLAPNNYDGEIILTKMGSIKTLSGFDGQAIEAFIGS